MSTGIPIVISGVGMVNASGENLDHFWKRAFAGDMALTRRRFFPEPEPPHQVGTVSDEWLRTVLPLRESRKLDRFSLMAISAARQALSEASVSRWDRGRETTGILVGNCTGGWTFVEPMMYGLLSRGYEAINPYVATAWFPAAPQGEISILEGLGGHSKTFSLGGASSGFALSTGCSLLRQKQATGMLVGGAEAPLTPLVISALLDSEPSSAVPCRNQLPLGEGAAFLYIEESESASRREVNPLAQVVGCAFAGELDSALGRAMKEAELSASDIDLVILGSSSDLQWHEESRACLWDVFGGRQRPLFTAPRTLFGDSLGASMAMDLVAACLCLKHQAALPTIGEHENPEELPGDLVLGEGRHTLLRNVLVFGQGEAGQAVAAVLTDCNSSRRSCE